MEAFSIATVNFRLHQLHLGGEGGGVLPYKRLMGMCRWMGLHFHDWSDYNGVAFSIVTRVGSHIFRFLG